MFTSSIVQSLDGYVTSVTHTVTGREPQQYMSALTATIRYLRGTFHKYSLHRRSAKLISCFIFRLHPYSTWKIFARWLGVWSIFLEIKFSVFVLRCDGQKHRCRFNRSDMKLNEKRLCYWGKVGTLKPLLTLNL